MTPRESHPSCAPRGGRGRPARRAASGFTLLELLVVLGIVALTGVVIAPSVASWSKGAEQRAVRAQVIAAVRGAQTESARRGVPIVVVYDPSTGRIVAGETGKIEPPRGWAVEHGGRRLARPGEPGAEGAPPEELFAWSPEGLASASAWRLVGPGGATVSVECDAVDGVRVR